MIAGEFKVTGVNIVTLVNNPVAKFAFVNKTETVLAAVVGTETHNIQVTLPTGQGMVSYAIKTMSSTSQVATQAVAAWKTGQLAPELAKGLTAVPGMNNVAVTEVSEPTMIQLPPANPFSSPAEGRVPPTVPLQPPLGPPGPLIPSPSPEVRSIPSPSPEVRSRIEGAVVVKNIDFAAFASNTGVSQALANILANIAQKDITIDAGTDAALVSVSVELPKIHFTISEPMSLAMFIVASLNGKLLAHLQSDLAAIPEIQNVATGTIGVSIVEPPHLINETVHPPWDPTTISPANGIVATKGVSSNKQVVKVTPGSNLTHQPKAGSNFTLQPNGTLQAEEEKSSKTGLTIGIVVGVIAFLFVVCGGVGMLARPSGNVATGAGDGSGQQDAQGADATASGTTEGAPAASGGEGALSPAPAAAPADAPAPAAAAPAPAHHDEPEDHSDEGF
jgi:hypothetical protein